MGMINTTDYPSYAKVTPVDDYGRPIETPVDEIDEAHKAEIDETPKAEVDENKAEVA